MNRDAHGSATAALIQGGFHPTYLVPRVDSRARAVAGADGPRRHRGPDREKIDCVLLTSPNYFGIVGELAEIVALAHARGIRSS